MKHWKKRLAAGISALTLTLTLAPASFGAETLTRGEARDRLLAAADDYTAGQDILQGDEKGEKANSGSQQDGIGRAHV